MAGTEDIKKRPTLLLQSCILFTASVPGILLFFWIVTLLFEQPGRESLVVQGAAVFSVIVSCTGTMLGFVAALIETIRGKDLAKILMILNGICAVIWIVLIVVMIAAELGAAV